MQTGNVPKGRSSFNLNDKDWVTVYVGIYLSEYPGGNAHTWWWVLGWSIINSFCRDNRRDE